MRFAYVGANYASYLRSLYARHPLLALEPFLVQEQTLYRDSFGWNGCWAEPMAAQGYEAREFYLDNPLLDKAWHRQQGDQAPRDSFAIALARLTAFAPDVVFYDHGDAALLRTLKERPNAPLVICLLYTSPSPRD